MNILIYSIGIYPDRSGGLVRYSTDLALQLSKQNKVFYLMPGKLGFIDRTVRIKKTKSENELNVFVVNNAHPIPIYAGVKDVALYTKSTDQSIYETFLKDHGIEIIHLHSLMGLHVEFLRAAKSLGIPVVMTTHDFFGLCPVVTLCKNGDVCKEKEIGANCLGCSQGAHSYLKLAIGQSDVYRRLKRKAVIKAFRNKTLLKEKHTSIDAKTPDVSKYDYEELNTYYRECFSLISYYLFNSNQTKSVFESRLGQLKGDVVPLLLPSIKDRRKKRKRHNGDRLRVGFMGESTVFKGYFILKTAIEELVNEGYEIELDVYNDSVVNDGIVVNKGKYVSADLESIYDFLDVIVVPSICYETLSFSVIESLSYGMPCVVSDRVGAKDFITANSTGFIVEAGNSNDLKSCIIRIATDDSLIENISNNLNAEELSFDFIAHCKSVCEVYDGVLYSS